MIERLVILLAVVGLALALVWAWERTKPRRARIDPGITVITGPDCRLCPALILALDVAGVEYRRVDVSVEAAPAGVRSLPTILVADSAGAVAIRRSGRSAIADLDTVLGMAAANGSIRESA
ncbi:MAG: hypothetical protein WD990_08555 [Acidimicrobiia bacterium]